MTCWITYILQCADGSLYTGITNDLPRRISDHESGKGAKYTKGRGPFRLVYQESHANRSTASKREIAIKSLSRNEKIMLIEDHTGVFPNYSLRNISYYIRGTSLREDCYHIERSEM